MWIYRLYEFLFDPWTVSILEEGVFKFPYLVNYATGEFKYVDRPYVKYKLTHKFNGSEKIKIKYLN